MRSMNFNYPNLPTAVDELGADAEYLALTYPDLALVRVRQMVEVLATHLEDRIRHAPKHGGPDLYQRLLDCKDRFPSGFKAYMFGTKPCPAKRHVPIHVLNEACHHATTRRRDVSSYTCKAVELLQTMSELWAAVAGTTARPFELPLDGQEWRHHVWKEHITLNRAERLADQRRDFSAAQAELERVSESALIRLGAPQEERDLVWLRIESIRLAMTNHQGIPPVLHEDNDVIDRLKGWSDQRGRDQIHRLANRQAVGLTNSLRLDEALACISKHIEWREWTHAAAIERAGEQPIFDHERGALLGTAGQITAFQAHANQDIGLLDEAVECFEAATKYFALDSDRYRQGTYRLHALIEKVRLGGALRGDEESVVLEAIRGIEPGALQDTHLFNEKFRLLWALKASHVLGTVLPSGVRDEVFRWGADIDGEEPLGHPDVSIAGWAVVAYPNAPKGLRGALERTSSQEQGLIGWIARVFHAEVNGEAYPEPPVPLKHWWDDHDLSCRERSGAVAVLPFNFA